MLTTKVEMAYKYDLLWQSNDKIYVTDGENFDTFTLSQGQGTTKGTFTQDGSSTFSKEVEAYYPQSMVKGQNLYWPEIQTQNQTVPMYSKSTLQGTKDESMNFSSLGSVLQIVLNTTQENITLKKIVIKDENKFLSGSFSVNEDGQAIITSENGAGITLDLAQGHVLGRGANYLT
ncbi:MAG: hypothetical protein KBS95_00025 [Alistipes sp.]|nr:hypothetical protein [Candidatus Alistipes equi]